MQRSVHEIQVALRVLQAISFSSLPDPQDVEELHRIVPAADYDSLDEMACDVIQQAVEHRKLERDAELGRRNQRRRASHSGDR